MTGGNLVAWRAARVSYLHTATGSLALAAARPIDKGVASSGARPSTASSCRMIRRASLSAW